MTYSCRGKCRMHPNVTKRPCQKRGYAEGIKHCSVCDRGFLNYDKNRCECCGNVLRIPECNLQSRVKHYIGEETEVIA